SRPAGSETICDGGKFAIAYGTDRMGQSGASRLVMSLGGELHDELSWYHVRSNGFDRFCRCDGRRTRGSGEAEERKEDMPQREDDRLADAGEPDLHDPGAMGRAGGSYQARLRRNDAIGSRRHEFGLESG